MKKVFSMLFIALFAFVLISCGAKEIKLSLNDADKSITLVEGEERTIVPTLVGEATLVWSSSDDAIASVSNGTITAISSGSVVITVSVKDHDDIKAEITVTVNAKEVFEISVTEKALTLQVDDTKQITPTYTEGAELVWKSSDPTVVSVNNGLLTALKAGSATITVAIAGHEEVKAEITVTVNAKEVFEISVAEKALTLQVDDTKQITPTYTEGAELVWKSSDPTVVSVNNGLLTALKVGSATITVAIVGHEEVKAAIAVTVEETPLVEEIEIDADFETLKIGQSEFVFVDVYPSKANQEVEWTITPAGSVSISDNGQITALAGGLVTIRATAKDGSGIYDEKTFRVFNDATDFEIQGAEVMSPGTTQTLIVKLLVDYCQSTFKWESSNPEVATINENGLVTAVADGTVTITATAVDSTGISKTFTISVSGIKITIGDAEYPSFEDALEAAKEGDVIVLDQGTYKDNYTIAVNGLTITSEDKEKTIITGVITLAKDVANTKFEKLTFQGSGKLTSEAEGGQDGITVDNCIFDSCTNDGFIRLEGPAKNLVFTNNLVINNKSARGVRAEKTLEGFIATDNEFYDGGGTYDWLRTQGAISGEVVIERNIAIGSSQSFIMFMYHGSGNFTIKDNEIYDMDCVAIDIRTSNGVACTSTFNIIHNLMNNSNVDPSGVWNPVRLRFNDYTQETLEVNVNYNIYINWMDSKEANQFIEDASNCTLGWINADNNYFDGYTAEELSDKLFDNIASSYLNPFTDLDELEKAYQIANIDLDTNVLLVGESEDFKKEKYATLEAALAAAHDGNVIYLLPGSHTGDVKITLNNITITSLNGEFNPNGEATRKEEATYEGIITLAKGLSNLTISGIKFVGKAQILNEKGDAGTASNPAVNLNGFNFINNIVESALNNTAKGFIYTVEGSSGYSHNINIANNLFTAASGFAAETMLFIDNNYDLSLVGNTFKDITAKNVAYFHDTTKGLSGQLTTLNSNKFENITGNGLWINWLSPLPNGSKTAEVSIQDNDFVNVSGTAFYMGSMNNADTYVAINIKFNEFTKVGSAIVLNRVHANANISCNYNIFHDVPTVYIQNNKTASANSVLNAKDNLFLSDGNPITPEASKFVGADMIDYETTISSIKDLPSFDSKANAIEIVCPDLYVGDTYELQVKYIPANTQNYGVTWTVSDESIAKIDDKGVITCLKTGTVTLTATYIHNPEVTATYELTITDFREVSFKFDNDGTLSVGEEFDIAAKIVGSSENGTIVWTSSNPNVATVVDGKVTAVSVGTTTITATIEGTDITTSYTVTVDELSDMDALLKLLVEGNNGYVWYEKINYIGYETGYTSSPHYVYGSVNNYWAGTLPELTKNMLSTTAANYSGQTMKSIEFIVYHDTGSASPGASAQANSKWCTNASNNTTSWHYTIGNDGIFQQLEDNVVGWHAGDGTSWGETTEFFDTGIKADPDLRNRAKVTLNADGYFYINGQKSLVKMPEGSTVSTGTNDLGIAAVVINGNYHLPTTYITSGYGNRVAIRGGGLNGIGIESAVNTGSDVYKTWQYSAKFIAQLLIKHNLTPERVMFHNNFSNKTCPQTMMTAKKTEMFLDMCYLEYYVAKNYSDYTITFTSNNPEIVDNEGRIVGNGPYKTTEVSYTITVTKGTESKSATVYSVVQGSYKH